MTDGTWKEYIRTMVYVARWEGQTYKNFRGGWTHRIYYLTLLFGVVPVWFRIRYRSGIM